MGVYLTEYERDTLKLDEATAVAFDRQRVAGWYSLLARAAVVRACGYGSPELAAFDALAGRADATPRVVVGWEYLDARRGEVFVIAARLKALEGGHTSSPSI